MPLRQSFDVEYWVNDVILRSIPMIYQIALGYGKKYGATNPFDWMELISLQ